MRKGRTILPALVAVFSGVITVFIARSSDKPSDCFIWKTRINESTFYLAGSIHGASEGNYPVSKAYLKCYKKADIVILELEDDMNSLKEKIFQYAEKDRLKEDQYLNYHLSSESLDKLKEIFDDDELYHYCQYESWLLNMAIAGTKSRLIGYDPSLAIDKYFNNLARKDKKEIIGLDDLQMQLLLFKYEVPFDVQVKIIEKAASEMEIQANKEAPLYRAYFDNDILQFDNIFLKSFDFNKPGMKEAYNTVFANRNKRWVEQLERLSGERPGTYFVLVGSGHFFGPDNIRELLERKGYKIEKE